MKKTILRSILFTASASLVILPATAAAEGAFGARGDDGEPVKFEAPEVAMTTPAPKRPAATVSKKKDVTLPTARVAKKRAPSVDRTVARFASRLAICSDLTRMLRRPATRSLDVALVLDAGRVASVSVTHHGRKLDAGTCMKLKIRDWRLPKTDRTEKIYRLSIDAKQRLAMIPVPEEDE